MGLKVVIANFSFLAIANTGALKLGSKWNLSTLALLNIAAFSFLFLLLAPWAAPISRISNLTKEFSLLLYLFDFLLWRWWTRKESSISFPGHSLVSSCFQFCQKFCDLVAKKLGGDGLRLCNWWIALNHIIYEIHRNKRFPVSYGHIVSPPPQGWLISKDGVWEK